MVHVGVGTQDAHGGESRLLQGLLQLLPLLGKAGVQQDAVFLVHLVQGDELKALQHPGISLYLRQFHRVSFVSWESSRCFRYTINTATSAGDTPDTRLAWPRFSGRISSSFCRASRRRPWMDW